MTTNRSGFTIVEVVVAMLVLSVGLLGLAASAGAATKMIAQGNRYTEASTLANERFEILSTERCPTVATGSETRGAYSLSWTVVSAAGGRARELNVSVTSPTSRGTRTDAFTTVRFCP